MSEESLIVKVQLSIASNIMKRQALVYNRDRTISWQGDAEPEVIRLMKGRKKAFFHASLLKDGRVGLLSEVPDPGW